jgi:methylase of polypeptide subunit release factors
LTREGLQVLNRLATRSGYRAFHLVCNDGNKRDRAWAQFSAATVDPLRALVELFLLLRPIDPSRARAVLGATLLEELVADQVLVETPQGIVTDRLILLSFRSLLFFCEHLPRPQIYFGADSVALGVYQSPVPGGVVIDVCSGSAIQAMIAALHARRAYAVEINPRAARIASRNVMMNHLEDRVQVFNLPLEQFAQQVPEPADLVTANPPLLPIPETLDYPFVGDGGPDGLAVTRRILDLYLPHLSAAGGVEFIGCGLGTDGRATFVDSVHDTLARHGARGRVFLVGRSRLERGDGFHDSLVMTAAVNSRIDLEVSHSVCALHFERLGANQMYLFFMRVERGGHGEVEIVDVSDGSQSWFS